MKKSIIAAFTVVAILSLAGTGIAGGKRDGSSCHVHKSCQSKLCVRVHPEDKFGVCCHGQSCAEVNAQCGETVDQCGVPLECGSCSPGFACENNQCVSGTTTTTAGPPPTSTTTTIPGQTTTTMS